MFRTARDKWLKTERMIIYRRLSEGSSETVVEHDCAMLHLCFGGVMTASTQRQNGRFGLMPPFLTASSSAASKDHRTNEQNHIRMDATAQTATELIERHQRHHRKQALVHQIL